MKKVCYLPILAAILLSACSSDQTTETHLNNSDQGAVAGPLPEPANSPSSSPSPATSSTATAPAPTATTQASTASTPPPSNSTAGQTTTDYPKGIPVPGKKGMVFSPYAQYAGQVDVNGFPSGSIVVCPFTHKKFVVP